MSQSSCQFESFVRRLGVLYTDCRKLKIPENYEVRWTGDLDPMSQPRDQGNDDEQYSKDLLVELPKASLAWS
jgi:hypothetical protein